MQGLMGPVPAADAAVAPSLRGRGATAVSSSGDRNKSEESEIKRSEVILQRMRNVRFAKSDF